MNERELSKKLEELGDMIDECTLEDNYEGLSNIAKELRQLANETYAPGNSVSWDDVKNQAKSTQKRFPF